MQKLKIPVTLDPVKAAQKRSGYSGIVPLNTLIRLKDGLMAYQDDVTVRIECEIDQQNLTVLNGTAHCQVSVKCERCGEPIPLTLDVSFAYTPVKGDDNAALELIPERYDVVERDEHGEINLRQLIEDELILALPLFPMHDAVDCQVDPDSLSFGDIGPEPEKPNPFAILQELKKK
ncbi:23S rRNA accumulation protein YceD [Rheinheimera sp. UJ63]|uniref:23S rRNA accumulation protein YceD n=1 Tax=Rheinheimera sp. UJ63 TaxID=2910157 RepID=UPI001F346CE3|nr:23S rRNA accumulation protein YceD [Rheinheimera sp. UJ63]MCF4009468.1 23S rRNA accumulation protein YceD [Rheinheimera sp. UJ63]